MTKEAIRKAMNHPDKLGAGARKREHLPPKERGEAVMKEYGRGTLRSGSGEHVKNVKQAIAIKYNEERKHGSSKR
jgi:uncharacterized protein DUF6496